MSRSPKNCSKNGSPAKGLNARRGGCTDAMFVTALTVRSATALKAGAGGALARRAGGGASGAGTVSTDAARAVPAAAVSADRRRPVRTRPAANPVKRSSAARSRRRNTSVHVDAPRTRAGGLRDRDGEHAVLEVRDDAFGVDGGRQREAPEEGAVAALHAVIALARHVQRRARALQRELSVVVADVEVLAPQSRQLRGQDVGFRGLDDVDGGRPAGGVLPGEALDPFVDRQQIPERVPACEGHERILARLSGSGRLW